MSDLGDYVSKYHLREVDLGEVLEWEGPILPLVIKGYNDDPNELSTFYAARRQAAQAFPIELMDGTELTECQLCGEPIDDEMGEFWDPAKEESVIAHGQCGIDAGLEMA